ncbi:MAG: hypothetical protein KAW46_02765 [candidate division Zixibacteria bacterium]|nr:hypothetical protein [candidate division Zixibacteria bacterium]
MQSAFVAEQGAWLWIQSFGGLNDELLLADSAPFARALVFNPLGSVEFWETEWSESFVEPEWEVGYTIEWTVDTVVRQAEGETVDSVVVRRQVLRYEGGIHAPQTIEFIGRDTLVLTDLMINGYTHTYERF